ncbi:11327_t:CDS:2 [Funneliformis caledonium]|uniref:11327_t:CDS:1 n=1 Tax=Funneliformis caledonium TaxID=1117310 RepID=A0A9N8YQR9_9GLOM|nr:11327_t:CDS:2 [Funneliformis caledonium]
MEAMIKDFNERTRELKNFMLLRAEGACEETDEILCELRDSLGELETRVLQMSKFLEEEKVALERAKEVKAKLQSQHDHLEWMCQHLPKHLPGNIEPSTYDQTNLHPPNERNEQPQQCVPNHAQGQVHEQDPLQEIDLPLVEENPFYVSTQPTSNTNFVAMGLSYITVSEFKNVPKYIHNNRISRDKVNEAIDDFNKVIQEKYTILKSQQSTLSHKMKQKYWKYKEAENEETRDIVVGLKKFEGEGKPDM